MQIILSRKGFDSQYGGKPSPILPDGTMISFPIPEIGSHKYSEINTPLQRPISSFFPDLKINTKSEFCHLDPDLYDGAIKREHGWRPAFGQVDAAQSHLKNNGIGKGDLFLFFGLFRKTEFKNGRLQYVRNEKAIHAIFGYLEIETSFTVSCFDVVPLWLRCHPHVTQEKLYKKRNNTIYIASEKLSFAPHLSGGGLIKYSERKRLSKPGENKSKWQLDPKIFRNLKISYHNDNSWRDEYFQAASKGQEFIIDADDRVQEWARSLIIE